MWTGTMKGMVIRGGNNPPVPPVDGSEGKGEESRKKGKANKNTSKGKEKRRKKNRGKLLLDATVAPADIKYPTDIELLNKSREHLETAINKCYWFPLRKCRKAIVNII